MTYFVCPFCGNKVADDNNRKWIKDHLTMYHSAEILRRYAEFFVFDIPIYEQLNVVIEQSVFIEI